MTLDQNNFSSREFRNALGRFATGITVITASNNGQVYGMTANAFMSVSLDPPLVLVSVDKKAHMHEVLLQTDRYGVSILAEHQEKLSNHFAGRVVDGVAFEFIEKDGMMLLNDAVAHLVTTIINAQPAGDHTLFLAQVEFLEWQHGRPLLYYAGQYERLGPE